MLVRFWFLTRLFEGFDLTPHAVRAVAPVIPPVAAVLLVRLIEQGTTRTVWYAIAELVLFASATAAAAWLIEGRLLREALKYLRPAPAAA